MRDQDQSVQLFDGSCPQCSYRGRISEPVVKRAGRWAAIGFAAIVLFSTAATAVTKHTTRGIQSNHSDHTLPAGVGLRGTNGFAVVLY
jgi:hypothetical protein